MLILLQEEYKKKYFSELAEKAKQQKKRTNLNNFKEDPDILRMAVQVSDVLPYVPRNVIVANLSEYTNKPIKQFVLLNIFFVQYLFLINNIE